MYEYHKILDRSNLPFGQIFYQCETPDELLDKLNEVNISIKNIRLFDYLISEVKMLKRSKVIDKILNNE